MTRVLIVDDQPVFRMQLRRLLQRVGLDVIAEAGDIPTAEALVRSLRPDLAVVDVMLSLVIELAAGYAYVRLTHSPCRALWGVLLGNLLTVPILWFLVSASFARGAFPLTLALTELGAVVVEGALIAGLTRGQMPPARAFSMSLLLNVVSFILGAPVLSALTYLGLVQ